VVVILGRSLNKNAKQKILRITGLYIRRLAPQVWLRRGRGAGYAGEEAGKAALKKNAELILPVYERGYRNKPLTEKQKANNRRKFRVRRRVEHIFGHMTNTTGRLTVRCVGIVRAASMITLKNLAYNISRYVFLKTLGREKGTCRGVRKGRYLPPHRGNPPFSTRQGIKDMKSWFSDIKA
jgi:hypothetical protein